MLNTERSLLLYNKATQCIPGGVNSPVRSFRSVGGTPLFIEKAEGPFIYDADGNKFIDYVGSWGSMILGHAHPKVISAIQEAATRGTSFGTPTEAEIWLAERIISMVPHIDKVRMVNSGTEACMSAIRLARGYTGRDKIIKFTGCYHGHADAFLIKAGSGAATMSLPDSRGIPQAIIQDTLTAPYNDLSEIERLIEQYRRQIAAIIIEPVAGNMGCVPPLPGFLEGLRDLCDDEGILLIFDEVMTGFRLARGGAQELFRIIADIVVLGKIIGGGLPVGAYAARSDIMDYIAPLGPVYQAGTLSGNPLAVMAGYTVLTELNNHPEIYEQLENTGKRLANGIRSAFPQQTVQVNQVGSMLSVHFSAQPIINYETSSLADQELFKRFFHYLLQHGIYIPPSGFESWFISAAHTAEIVDTTIDVIRQFAAEIS